MTWIRAIWWFPKGSDFSALEEYRLSPEIVDTPFGKMLIYGDGDGLHFARYDGEASSKIRREVFIVSDESNQSHQIENHLQEAYGPILIQRGCKPMIHPILPYSTLISPDGEDDLGERVVNYIKFYNERNGQWPSVSNVADFTKIDYRVLRDVLFKLETSEVIIRRKQRNAMICELVNHDHS